MTTTNENVRLWSVTTGTANASTDGSIASSDSQSPDTVDNNIRSIMTSVKRQADDQGGWIVAGGTATALTVTTASGITTAMLANGLRLCVRTASAATGAATIAVDAATVTDIKKRGGAAILAGDWASGDILDLVYSSTATAFIVMGIGYPSGVAAFTASRSLSQSVTSLSPVTVSVDTEDFDVGAHYASSVWIPPVGTVLVGGSVYITNNSGVAAGFVLYLGYGATTIAQCNSAVVANAGTVQLSVSAISRADGVNGYLLQVQGSAQPYSVGGGASINFYGSMI